MGFGHIGLILLLFLLALIVFGPKRMIEMVSQLGKSLIETRDAMRQMNWSLSSDEEDSASPTTTTAAETRERLHVVESAPPSESTVDEE
jgi:Sec-independent protein translocase protein TatA